MKSMEPVLDQNYHLAEENSKLWKETQTNQKNFAMQLEEIRSTMLRQQEPSTTNSFGTSNSIPRSSNATSPETSKIGKEVNLLGGWPLDIVATGCIKEVDPTYKFHERCLGERSYLVYVDEVHAQDVALPYPHDAWCKNLGESCPGNVHLSLLMSPHVGGLYLPMIGALPDALLILGLHPRVPILGPTPQVIVGGSFVVWMCLEERLRGLINNLVRVSKQRVDLRGQDIELLSPRMLDDQILVMNRKAKEDWEKKPRKPEKIRKVNEVIPDLDGAKNASLFTDILNMVCGCVDNSSSDRYVGDFPDSPPPSGRHAHTELTEDDGKSYITVCTIRGLEVVLDKAMHLEDGKKIPRYARGALVGLLRPGTMSVFGTLLVIWGLVKEGLLGKPVNLRSPQKHVDCATLLVVREHLDVDKMVMVAQVQLTGAYSFSCQVLDNLHHKD
ncbi:hypothetical protein IFM89_010077 [Coptis chinensis]|uniref:Uncharacterized protein n=1 Tax=Coptis chinensis TaxID=261450 RepID=A0A835I2Q3_9MAGN|nr:hypothetical protein IFM89_010077 [Coptis chinensis]